MLAAINRSRLETLARQRQSRRLMRDLRAGRWREVLLDAERTQHLFRAQLKGNSESATKDTGVLVEFLNVVTLAIGMHVSVLLRQPPRFVADAAYPQQRAALARMREMDLPDTLIRRAVSMAYTEGEAWMSVRPMGGRVQVGLHSADECLAGPLGPGDQPQWCERRWIIERKDPSDPRRTVRYLRVERHTAQAGRGLVSQLAYAAKSDDVLVDLAELERVSLEQAVGVEGEVPEETTETGLPYPAMVQLVIDRDQSGEPVLLLPESEIQQVDAVMAAITKLSRSVSLHAAPKVRIAESMLDPKTGHVTNLDAIVDPHKIVEYIRADLQLAEMLEYVRQCLRNLAIRLHVSPTLIGMRSGEGAVPPTKGQLELEATATMALAQSTVLSIGPALSRLITMHSTLESSMPLPVGGYDVGPVSVRFAPGLPSGPATIAEEQERLLASRLTSRRRAVAAIHGDDLVDEVIAEMDADGDAEAERQRAASFGAVGMSNGSDIPDPDPADGPDRPGGDA